MKTPASPTVPTAPEASVKSSAQPVSPGTPEGLKPAAKKNSKGLLFIIPVVVVFLLLLGLLVAGALRASSSNRELSLFSPDGSLEYKKPGTANYLTLKDNTITFNSHVVLRSGVALGAVMLPDDSMIIIEPQSELRIDTDVSGAYIRQIKGASFHDVSPRNGWNYKVFTPYSTSVAEGTDFLVYVWDPAFGTYVLQAPGAATAPAAWPSGSGTSVNEGRVGFRADITTPANTGYDENNVPEGPLQQVIGGVTEIINGGRSPYDIVPGAIDTGSGWSHLDAGNNSAVNGSSGTTASGTNTGSQASYSAARRELINQLRQLERDYRAGRISQAVYLQRLREILNGPNAAAMGSLSPAVTNGNTSLEGWDCAYYEAYIKPVLRRVLDRIYNDPSGAYLNLSLTLPNGVEYYDNFTQHVCDDGQLDSSEQAYIHQVLRAVGAE